MWAAEGAAGMEAAAAVAVRRKGAPGERDGDEWIMTATAVGEEATGGSKRRRRAGGGSSGEDAARRRPEAEGGDDGDEGGGMNRRGRSDRKGD